MAILPIRIYPDPVLRVKTRRIEIFDAALRKLAADMVETMHAAPGVGLAAPQIGSELRLAGALQGRRADHRSQAQPRGAGAGSGRQLRSARVPGGPARAAQRP